MQWFVLIFVKIDHENFFAMEQSHCNIITVPSNVRTLVRARDTRRTQNFTQSYSLFKTYTCAFTQMAYVYVYIDINHVVSMQTFIRIYRSNNFTPAARFLSARSAKRSDRELEQEVEMKEHPDCRTLSSSLRSIKSRSPEYTNDFGFFQ